MPRRARTLCLTVALAILAVSQSGCGTLVNLASLPAPLPSGHSVRR
jgi:hypothetical protein